MRWGIFICIRPRVIVHPPLLNFKILSKSFLWCIVHCQSLLTQADLWHRRTLDLLLLITNYSSILLLHQPQLQRQHNCFSTNSPSLHLTSRLKFVTCQFQKLPWKVSVHKVLSIKNCVQRTRKRILLKCDFWDIKICFLISSRRKRIILKSGISKDAIWDFKNCFLISSKTNSSF